jgi:hypothetical protein
MKQPVSPDDRAQIAAIVKTLPQLDRHRLAELAALARSHPATSLWPGDERFWWSGTAGLQLGSRVTIKLMQGLWEAILARIARDLIVTDAPEGHAPRSRIVRFHFPATPTSLFSEGEAVTVIERLADGEAWTGIVPIWNACVAALLEHELGPELMVALESAWIRADFGPTPAAVLSGSAWPRISD